MTDRDQAFSILLLVALLISILVFFYARLMKGQSRSISVFFGGTAFGGTLCVCTFFAYTVFLEPPRGMGLERIIVPIAFLIVSSIVSLIASLIIYMVGNRKAPTTANLSPEAQKILREASVKLKDF